MALLAITRSVQQRVVVTYTKVSDLSATLNPKPQTLNPKQVVMVYTKVSDLSAAVGSAVSQIVDKTLGPRPLLQPGPGPGGSGGGESGPGPGGSGGGEPAAAASMAAWPAVRPLDGYFLSPRLRL